VESQCVFLWDHPKETKGGENMIWQVWICSNRTSVRLTYVRVRIQVTRKGWKLINSTMFSVGYFDPKTLCYNPSFILDIVTGPVKRLCRPPASPISNQLMFWSQN